MFEPLTRREFLIKTAVVSASAADLSPGALGQGGSQGGSQRAGGWMIGCYTRPWAEHDFRVAFDAVAEAGFKHVGLMSSSTGLIISAKTTPEEAAKVGEEARRRGLTIPSMWGGDIRVQESLEAGIEDMRRLIDCAAAAPVGNILMGGTTRNELVDVYYKAIAATCDYAAEKKVGISIKPHGGGNSTGPECRKLIEKIGNRNFRLWYDPGNIYYYSDGALDPVDDSKTVDGLVVGMSVKDFQAPKNVDLTPGTGMVNFPRVMANLSRGGFRSGPLLVETLKPGTLPELLAEARAARSFVAGLVK